MHAEETILFIAVAALALALVVSLVAPKLVDRERGASQGRDHPPPGSPPARPEPDARQVLVQAAPPPQAQPPPPPRLPPSPPPSLVCPTCGKQFAAGLRFCPYDARLLSVDGHSPGRGAEMALPPSAVGPMANTGKICPSCARRYDSAATVCGRDGAALVSVN